MTATALKTATKTATYVGPLWVINRAVVGRDDRSGRLVCICPTYQRNGRCRHLSNVICNRRRDAVYHLPDLGADALEVSFTWITRLLGLDQPSERIGGCTVTLKRIGTTSS